jgi:MFS family permease
MNKTHSKNSNAPLKTSFYYGWVIIFIAAMSLFFSGPGQTFSISVFIDYYIEDFGWSRSLVSSIYSFATLLSGALIFLMGRMVDKFGQRNMTFVVVVLLGLTCLWNSFIAGPIMLFIGFFMLRFWGQGSLVLLPNTLVAQWFMKQRGRAFSLLNVGGFVGAFAFPALNAWMIYTWGWPATWRVWAVILAFGFAPLAYYLIRNKPEDIGLLPDSPSARNQPSQKAVDSSKEEVNVEEDWTLQEAMRTRAFWLFLFIVSIPSMINTGIVFHLFSILSENNLSRTVSASVLAIMPFVSFPVSLIAGVLVDRFKIHYIVAVVFVGQLIAMFLLLYSDSITMAVFFSVSIGIVNGFFAICFGIIWPNYFGRKHIGSIKGVAMTSMVIGSALGPLPFGIAYDYFGGYMEIMLLMAVFPLLAIISSMISPPPSKK